MGTAELETQLVRHPVVTQVLVRLVPEAIMFPVMCAPDALSAGAGHIRGCAGGILRKPSAAARESKEENQLHRHWATFVCVR